MNYVNFLVGSCGGFTREQQFHINTNLGSQQHAPKRKEHST